MARPTPKTETWFVQAIQCDRFEDFYVQATSAADAISQARKLTTLDPRWARFAV